MSLDRVYAHLPTTMLDADPGFFRVASRGTTPLCSGCLKGYLEMKNKQSP
jgi:hypothetical protein